MATTGRVRSKAVFRLSAAALRLAGHWPSAAAAVAALALPTSAAAQKWTIDSGISSDLTWSSNARLGGNGTDSGSSGGDVLLDVRPRIRLLAEGARLKLSGSAALSVVTYADRSQPTRLQPDIDLTGSLTAIERLLFIDASLRAVQNSANVYGPRPENGATSENSVTTTQARVSPRIEGQLGSAQRYRLLSENTWTRESGATTTVPGLSVGGYFGRHSVLVEQDPRPFGWKVEAERVKTRYRNAVEDPLVIDLGRLTLDYEFAADFAAGVHAGRERTSFQTGNSGGNLIGVQAKWTPSLRTTLSAFEEKRFFGTAWKLSFDHRTPQIAWNIGTSRSVETSPQSVLDVPGSGNVAAILDAIFTTRYPDPVERARVVNEFIAREGLPTSTLRPIFVRAQRLSLTTLSSASVTLIGVRNSLSLVVFQTRTEDAIDSGPLATALAFTNNTQTGLAIAGSHRLSPALSLTGSADWSRVRALRSTAGEESSQRTVRLQVNAEVVKKTTLSAGARYRDFKSSTTSDSREAAVFVGVDQRF